MLDREPIALQCSLLSAQACGVVSVQDYTQHAEPEAASSSQHQSLPSQPDSDQQASTSQVCQALASHMYAESLNVPYPSVMI